MKNFKTAIYLLIAILFSGQTSFAGWVITPGTNVNVSPGITVHTTGNLIIQATGLLTNEGTISIEGSMFNHEGSFLGNGVFDFAGSASQEIGGTVVPSFGQLKISNQVDLQADVSVDNELILNGDKIVLGNYDLNINPGGQISGIDPGTAYIVAGADGTIKQEVGATPVDFPVGSSASYSPVTLQNNGVLDNYNVRVFSDVLDNGISGTTIADIDKLVNKTWVVEEEISGGSDLDLTVQWNATDEGSSFTRTSSAISHYSSNWISSLESPASGNGPYTQVRSGLSELGAFAVFSGFTAPVTTTASLTGQCYNSTIGVPVTVTNFNNVGGISLVMDFDSSFLSLSGVTWNSAITGGQHLEPVPGKITFSWISTTGVNLQDNDTLLTLDFTYIGTNACPSPAATVLNWDNSDPTYLEYSTPDGIVLEDDPYATYYINGSIEVSDTTKPVIATCPPALVIEGCTTNDISNGGLTALAYSETSVTVTEAEFIAEGGDASDNCGGALVYSYVDVSTGACPIAVTRTWTVTDACGNFITCDQSIEIDDTTPPTLTCPTPDASYLVNDVCIWNASGLEFVAYDDNCETPSLWYSIDGGSTFISCTDQGINGLDFAIGDTEVIYKAVDACDNETTCSFTVHVDGITVTGSVDYYNTGLTSMDNDVTLVLQQGGTDILTTSTIAGIYTFDDVCLGTYDLVVSTTKGNGGINSTDAAQVNYWSVFNTSIQAARFYAGDVNSSNSILAGDASQIQQYFLTLGNPSVPFATEWSFWNVDEMIGSNAGATGGYPQLTVTNASSIITNDMYAMVTGDFNSSFTPGAKSPQSGNINLTYGDLIEVGTGEFELPVYAGMDMEIGAISLIMNVPPDLLEVLDVYMGDESLLYSINGDELRISWMSLNSQSIQKGDVMFTLLMNLNGDTGEDGIKLSLVDDPLNELADGSYNVINNAEIVVDIIMGYVTGINSIGTNGQLTLSNYPNPFKQTTNLVYRIPEEGKVTLEVYSLLGNKMKTVVNKRQESGEYQVKLDAAILQPGVYTAMLRLETDNDVLFKTIKIINK